MSLEPLECARDIEEKVFYLHKLAELKDRGLALSRPFSIDDPLFVIRFEYEKIRERHRAREHEVNRGFVWGMFSVFLGVVSHDANGNVTSEAGAAMSCCMKDIATGRGGSELLENFARAHVYRTDPASTRGGSASSLTGGDMMRYAVVRQHQVVMSENKDGGARRTEDRV